MTLKKSEWLLLCTSLDLERIIANIDKLNNTALSLAETWLIWFTWDALLPDGSDAWNVINACAHF